MEEQTLEPIAPGNCVQEFGRRRRVKSDSIGGKCQPQRQDMLLVHKRSKAKPVPGFVSAQTDRFPNQWRQRKIPRRWHIDVERSATVVIDIYNSAET